MYLFSLSQVSLKEANHHASEQQGNTMDFKWRDDPMGAKINPPPPILLIYIFSHHERLHCFDTVKSPYFNQATQKNSLIDHP